MAIRVLSPLIRIPPAKLPGVLHLRVVIAGTPDIPVRRRVQLFTYANAHGMAFPTNATPVRWQWSAPDGTVTFDNLDPAQVYGSIAYDHTGEHAPTVQINLIPEVLP